MPFYCIPELLRVLASADPAFPVAVVPAEGVAVVGEEEGGGCAPVSFRGLP